MFDVAHMQQIARDLESARLAASARVARGTLEPGVMIGGPQWGRIRDEAFLTTARGLASTRNAATIDAAGIGIPAFTKQGLLPTGAWQARTGELQLRIAGDERRERLLGAVQAIKPQLRDFDVEHIVIGGSFASAKAVPGDLDAALVTRAPLSTARRAELREMLAAVPAVRRHQLQLLIADDVVQGASLYNHGTSGRHREGESMLEFFATTRHGGQRGLLAVPVNDL